MVDLDSPSFNWLDWVIFVSIVNWMERGTWWVLEYPVAVQL